MNDGTVGYICPQAPTKWYEDAVGALPGKGAAIPPGVSDLEESEDCLFLDVVVPSKPFEEGKSGRAHLTPVLFNIHGGGNFIGSKGATNAYSPGGLLERSNNSMIYVAINYRVCHILCIGALGKRLTCCSLALLISCPTLQTRKPM